MEEKNAYCRYCGKPIDEDAKFCTHCGKHQTLTSTTMTKKQGYRKRIL